MRTYATSAGVTSFGSVGGTGGVGGGGSVFGNSGGGSAFGSSAEVAGLVSALACFTSECCLFKV